MWWQEPVTRLKGIGPKKALEFENINVARFYYFIFFDFIFSSQIIYFNIILIFFFIF